MNRATVVWGIKGKLKRGGIQTFLERPLIFSEQRIIGKVQISPTILLFKLA